MYLRRGTRLGCWILLVFGLLLVAVATVAAIGDTGKERRNTLLGGAILAALFVLPPGIPLLRYYLSDARRLVPRRDVLRDHLHLSGIAEVRGVQFVALPFPDDIHPPSHLGLSVFLQNCHAAPRNVEVRVTRAPFRVVERNPFRVGLKGGESGVLFILGFAGPDLKPGEHAIGFQVHVRQPGPVGVRVIARDEPPRVGLGGSRRSALFSVQAARPLGETPGYPGLVEQRGYRPIMSSGEETVREESLAFLTLPG
jgi:hypothetical protein